ncbi:MAG: branched-chain amino acid ABC transporter permease [Hyphomicrobiales bacterium]|nr:branched-chain amino acid ABC transporter permease [Hyphomicrobiales bacterium]
MSAQVLQLAINALAAGCIYAVVALSVEIAYESTGVVNFAAGQLVTAGALIGLSAVAYTKFNFLPAYLLVIVGMSMIGIVFLICVYLPLRRQSVLTIVIGTVGVGIFIQNVMLLTWGPLPKSVRSPMGSGAIKFGDVSVSLHVLYVIGVTALLIIGMYLLLYRSSLGRQFRATAQDPEAATLMGIRVKQLYALNWILVCVLSGIAGLLFAPMWLVDVTSGDNIGLKAFAAIMIGGFGSVPGAILGGIIVGAIEIFGAFYVSSAFKDALVFALMFLFLLVRPQGIFGERAADRA